MYRKSGTIGICPTRKRKNEYGRLFLTLYNIERPQPEKTKTLRKAGAFFARGKRQGNGKESVRPKTEREATI